MQELTAQEIRRRRMPILVVSTIALLFLGLIYAFSMFAGPLCQTFGYEASSVGLTFNLMMIAFCLGGVVGSFVEKGAGLKVSLTLAGVLFLVGFAGTGLLGSFGVGVVYLLYGVCGGLGVGIGYNGLVSSTNSWFPDRLGLSSGVLMLGFGVSALVLGNLSVAVASAVGLPAVLVGLGIVTFAVALVAARVVRRAPEDVVRVMAPEKAPTKAAGTRASDDRSPLGTAIFWVYWAWVIAINCVGMAAIGSAVSDAQSVGVAATAAGLVAGLVSVCNGVSRIIFGVVYDRGGIKGAMALGVALATAASVLICAGLSIGLPALYVVGALSCGLCYGAGPVVGSAFARERYGARNYALNLSIVNFALVPSSLLNIAIQAIAGGSRPAVFVGEIVLCAIAIGALWPFSRLWDRDVRAERV